MYLNVRYLLVVLEPAIKEALEDFLFELNDVSTRTIVKGMIDDYMIGIKARRGVYDFYTQCDGDNNLATDIQNRRLNVNLYIKPTADIEEIPFTVVLTPYSMDFSLAKAAAGAAG